MCSQIPPRPNRAPERRGDIGNEKLSHPFSRPHPAWFSSPCRGAPITSVPRLFTASLRKRPPKQCAAAGWVSAGASGAPARQPCRSPFAPIHSAAPAAAVASDARLGSGNCESSRPATGATDRMSDHSSPEHRPFRYFATVSCTEPMFTTLMPAPTPTQMLRVRIGGHGDAATETFRGAAKRAVRLRFRRLLGRHSRGPISLGFCLRPAVARRHSLLQTSGKSLRGIRSGFASGFPQ